MAAWAESLNAGRVGFLADPEGASSGALGLLADKRAAALGVRSRRYAMLVRDGVIERCSCRAASWAARTSSSATSSASARPRRAPEGAACNPCRGRKFLPQGMEAPDPTAVR
jgi:hypothetical protein